MSTYTVKIDAADFSYCAGFVLPKGALVRFQRKRYPYSTPRFGVWDGKVIISQGLPWGISEVLWFERLYAETRYEVRWGAKDVEA